MAETGRAGVAVKIVAAGTSDIGRTRKHNEDTVLLRPDLQLFLLADGAGGHNAGNVASTLASTSVANYFEESEAEYSIMPDIDAFGLYTGARRLASAIQHANREVIEIANTSNKRKGMGTTFVALAASPQTGLIHLGHVGDSRCYRLRDQNFEQLTIDHSLLNDVLEMRPDMDDASLAKLPRTVVTRALGMEDPVRVTIKTLQIVPGDRYLLCSDGVTDALEDDMLSDVLGSCSSADETVRLLIEMANARESRDNLAVVVVWCEPSAGGASASKRPLRTTPRVSDRPAAQWAGGSADTTAMGTAVFNDEGPEIVLLGKEAEPEIEWESHVHVVPAESMNEDLLEALGELASPRGSNKG